MNLFETFFIFLCNNLAMKLNEKIENALHILSKKLFEREEVLKLSLLSLVAGESIFLLGPPGVAKSMVSREIGKIISGSKNFEYLMNRFSTPEEIFGPISLKKLDEDKYERIVDGYLPNCEIAFLDEIWKSSPSIQNTLLTIINEKIYKNGNEIIDVPLLLLVAASNELPAKNEGLEALYDRFLVRVFVDGIKQKSNFKNFLTSSKKITSTVAEDDKITVREIINAQDAIDRIKLPDNIIDLIMKIKKDLPKISLNNEIYISDRRWKKIVWVLKTSAYVGGRTEIAIGDILLLKHLLWDEVEEIEPISSYIDSLWEEHSKKLIGIDNSESNVVTKIQNEIIASSTKVKSPKFEWTKGKNGVLEKYYEFYCFDPNAGQQTILVKGEMKNGIFEPQNSSGLFHIIKNKKSIVANASNFSHVNNYITFEQQTHSISYFDLPIVNKSKTNILLQKIIDTNFDLSMDSAEKISSLFTINETSYPLVPHYKDKVSRLLSQYKSTINEYSNSLLMLEKVVKESIEWHNGMN